MIAIQRRMHLLFGAGGEGECHVIIPGTVEGELWKGNATSLSQGLPPPLRRLLLFVQLGAVLVGCLNGVLPHLHPVAFLGIAQRLREPLRARLHGFALKARIFNGFSRGPALVGDAVVRVDLRKCDARMRPVAHVPTRPSLPRACLLEKEEVILRNSVSGLFSLCTTVGFPPPPIPDPKARARGSGKGDHTAESSPHF